MVKRVLVVGNGPVGSSIARSLADRGASVTVIGPKSGGAFLSSHHDKGRIARVADAEGSVTWARRNKAALALYPALEQRSGVKFFTPCGALCVGDEAFLAPIIHGLDAAEAPYERISALSERFPYLRAPVSGAQGVWEPSAGFVNPAEMIMANNQLLLEAGGSVVEGLVSGIRVVEGDGVECTVDGDKVVAADRLVLACGGLTQHVLSQAAIPEALSYKFPEYRISKRSVCLTRVQPCDMESLASMPCIKMQISQAPSTSDACSHDRMEAGSVYILPPIEYADNEMLLKIGGGANEWLRDNPGSDSALEELREFMGTQGELGVIEALKDAVVGNTIEMQPEEVSGKACYTSCSDDDELKITPIVAVAVCQGKAASPAPAIGDEVAAFMQVQALLN